MFWGPTRRYRKAIRKLWQLIRRILEILPDLIKEKTDSYSGRAGCTA